MTRKYVWTAPTAVTLAMLFAACGGSSTAPSGGSGGSGGNGGSGGGGGSTGTTITISNNTVSPKNITVVQGTQVTFTNSDNRSHDMNSDPHPQHTDCPEINSVGFLNPGQSRQTANLNTVRTCGYHDHNQNTVESLQGTITITAR
jgi:plastocyanin